MAIDPLKMIERIRILLEEQEEALKEQENTIQKMRGRLSYWVERLESPENLDSVMDEMLETAEQL